MFLILAVALVVIYFVLLLAFHLTFWFIHIIIVFAVISFILQFVTGRK